MPVDRQLGASQTGQPGHLADVFATAQRLPLAQAASHLVGHGLPVFPCVPGGKHPLTRHGFLDATTNQTTVRSWWGRWPQANIGMPTGPLSGVDVVDVDVRPNGDGRSVFKAVASQASADGWAFTVRTPSGGLHLYFPADPERPQTSWACGTAHVDFRGAGGYIIVPPSAIQTGGQQVLYRLTSTQADARPMDAARLRQAVDPGYAARRLTARITRPPVAGDTSRLAVWVAARPEGERNVGLYWAACRMAEAGHDRDTALSALAGAAHDAGLLDREINTTVASAFRHSLPAPIVSTQPVMATAMTPVREAVVL